MDKYNSLLKSIFNEITLFRGGSGFYYQKPTKDEVIKILNDLKTSLEQNDELCKKSDCIILDTAGIGDLVHSRLVVQHIKRNYKNITWFVPPIIKSLYKDDNLVNVVEGCYIKYRNPNGNFVRRLVDLIDHILVSKFPDKKIYNMPANILRYFDSLNGKDAGDFPVFWMKSNGIERDLSIKHKITHNGKLNDLELNLKEKYIFLEYCCLSLLPLYSPICERFIDIMNSKNIDVVYVGAKTDPKLRNGIDCRGFSLYDTLTLIKNSIGAVHRGSGNSCLIAFYPNIPMFEVEAQATFSNGDYINKSLVHCLNSRNFIDYMVKYYNL